MEELIFDFMQAGEEEEVASLIWEVFKEFQYPGYKQEGINEFRQFILPENIKDRCANGLFFALVCKQAEKIVGIISMRDYKHVSLLFVKKEFQRRGIARRLFCLALEKCCQMKPQIRAITVNSAPYAVGIYERMGFTITAAAQEVKGITFIPMKFIIN